MLGKYFILTRFDTVFFLNFKTPKNIAILRTKCQKIFYRVNAYFLFIDYQLFPQEIYLKVVELKTDKTNE